MSKAETKAVATDATESGQADLFDTVEVTHFHAEIRDDHWDLASVLAYLSSTQVKRKDSGKLWLLDRTYEYGNGTWAAYSVSAYAEFTPVQGAKYGDKVFPAPVVFFSRDPGITGDIRCGELIDLL